jgi:hypothetical protein
MLKAHTDTKQTDTVIVRAVQIAIQVRTNQNAEHFPNPRGVDIERVSTSVTWGLSLVPLSLLTNIVTNLTKDIMDQMLTRATYHQPTLT